mmetsp:Transcript_128756/g.223298  ORF Transcript_128756/g.223298 Transcript_128756/m.223298 type:complete len:160 (-) Transcript_128756:148-627(-)
MSVNVAKLERKLNRSQSSPTHVWWEGPQASSGSRDLAELDPYSKWDCDGEIRKCADHRWRTISGIDRSRALKFGPSLDDIKWGKKMPEARPNNTKSPLAWRLDPYGAKLNNTFTSPRSIQSRSRQLVFNGKGGDRFTYNKQFLKDFTRVGSVTNVIRGG